MRPIRRRSGPLTAKKATISSLEQDWSGLRGSELRETAFRCVSAGKTSKPSWRFWQTARETVTTESPSSTSIQSPEVPLCPPWDAGSRCCGPGTKLKSTVTRQARYTLSWRAREPLSLQFGTEGRRRSTATTEEGGGVRQSTALGTKDAGTRLFGATILCPAASRQINLTLAMMRFVRSSVSDRSESILIRGEYVP